MTASAFTVPPTVALYRYQLVYPIFFHIENKFGCIRFIDHHLGPLSGSFAVITFTVQPWLQDQNIYYSARVLSVQSV